jgi:hypothetical protein
MAEKDVKRSLALALAVEHSKQPPTELLSRAKSYRNHLLCAKIQTMLRASLGRARYAAMDEVRVEVLAAMKALTDLTHFQNTKVEQVERALAHAERREMTGVSTYDRVTTHGGVLEHPTDKSGNKPVELIGHLKTLLLELKKEQVKVEMKKLMAADPILVWPKMQQLLQVHYILCYTVLYCTILYHTKQLRLQRMEDTSIEVHLGPVIEVRRLVDIVEPKQLKQFTQRIEGIVHCTPCTV